MSEKEWSDWNRQELTVLSKYFWAFVVFVVGVFLYFLPRVAWGDTTTMVYSDPQITLRLLKKPCTNEQVLQYLKPESHAKYQEALMVWEGRSLRSCWRVSDDGKAIINVDDEGDGLNPPLPVEVFKSDSGA